MGFEMILFEHSFRAEIELNLSLACFTAAIERRTEDLLNSTWRRAEISRRYFY